MFDHLDKDKKKTWEMFDRLDKAKKKRCSDGSSDDDSLDEG